jgi:hypothetical protein
MRKGSETCALCKSNHYFTLKTVGNIDFFAKFNKHKKNTVIQGGSDKSGVFFFLLSNDTAQLKIIRFD